MKRHLSVLGIISLAFIAVSCGKEISQEDLVGFYEANHEKGVDTLELRADGTYVHYFKSSEREKEFTNADQWDIEYKDRKTVIIFSKFISELSEFDKFDLPENVRMGAQKPGFYIVQAERSRFGFGPIRFYIDYDQGYYYEKK